MQCILIHVHRLEMQLTTNTITLYSVPFPVHITYTEIILITCCTTCYILVIYLLYTCYILVIYPFVIIIGSCFLYSFGNSPIKLSYIQHIKLLSFYYVNNGSWNYDNELHLVALYNLGGGGAGQLTILNIPHLLVL